MSGDTDPWSAHRRRTGQLRGRYPFAAEVLGLYSALLDVWGEVWESAREQAAADIPEWTVSQVMPRVVKVTEAAGPAALAAAVRELTPAEAADAFTRWLAGSDVDPVGSYLARACLRPALVALGEAAGDACARDPSPRGGTRCPRCGGLPQVSFRAAAGEALVSGRRHLVCCRCGHDWAYSASTCASCGETTGAKRTLYAEHVDGPVVRQEAVTQEAVTQKGVAHEPSVTIHPHIRIEACSTCERYLLDVELGRDPAAVPEVDELAAVPLALYAGDRGLQKITPNLMGL
jgi:FdhE protein